MHIQQHQTAQEPSNHLSGQVAAWRWLPIEGRQVRRQAHLHIAPARPSSLKPRAARNLLLARSPLRRHGKAPAPRGRVNRAGRPREHDAPAQDDEPMVMVDEDETAAEAGEQTEPPADA